MHDIIPEAEFNALPISAFKSAKSDRDRIALLPFNRSDWLKLQLKLIYSAPKANKTDLHVYTARYRAAAILTKNSRKIVYYISTMMAFNKSSRSVGDKDALQQRLPGVPPIVLDGLISRFTEIERSTNKCVSPRVFVVRQLNPGTGPR